MKPEILARHKFRVVVPPGATVEARRSYGNTDTWEITVVAPGVDELHAEAGLRTALRTLGTHSVYLADLMLDDLMNRDWGKTLWDRLPKEE